MSVRASLAALLSLPLLAPAAEETPAHLKHLKYRPIGPSAGGRVSQAVGIPGDPLVYYAATASGGVWKSIDGGLTWKSIFDDQPISSVGAIAVAPSDPNVVYVGSGEANIRGNVAAGNGIYVSTDAGKTWKHAWKQVGQIGRVIVHPTDPRTAYAAVLGHAFGPNPERGVYRTTDGGRNWRRVLFKDDDTGAIDVAFDPSNPRVLLAALWQARRRPWEMTSGGPGSGLCASRDGGDTWDQLKPKTDDGKETGLPAGQWGRIGIAYAPSRPQRVYALIEAEKGGLFRSDDGGSKWELVNPRRYLRQRAWYFSVLTVDPSNADRIFACNVPLLVSTDGGRDFRRVLGTHHVDNHGVWIDPQNPKRIIVANDGGVDITTNGGESWYAPPLPICQFYHVACDNRVPYRVSGCMQDMGTASGPSNSLAEEGILLGDWHTVGGGETGFTAPDPSDPDVVYAGEYGGYLSRYDHRTRTKRNVSAFPFNPSGITPTEMRYRFQWTAPLLISPHDPKTIYHAANVLFRTTDQGTTWEKVSGDLTRDDKNKQQWSGGPITGDNTGAEIYCTIFALAESPRQKGVLWAGSDDGLVHVSRDGGRTWQNVTANIPNLPDWSTVVCIEPSPFDAGTAYVVADAHRLDDYRPYIWRTTDFGKTWLGLAGDLPGDVYLHVVREDPKRKGLLFAGTERGVSVSPDGGKTWKPLKLNLPTVAVHDLVVKDDDLVVGTNGRSIWVLDDLTPLRGATPAVLEKSAHLFAPRPGVRWNYHEGFGSTAERAVGQNPPRGAVIDYHLKAKPKKPFTLEILDGAGKSVAKFDNTPPGPEPDETKPDGPGLLPRKAKLPDEAGVNRFVWDLRLPGAEIIPGAKVDMGNPTVGPRVLPGKYTVKLTVDGQTQSAPLELKPDLRVERAGKVPALADMVPQHELAVRLRDDVGKLTDVVKRLRAVRKQLVDRNRLLQDGDPEQAKAYKPLIDDSKTLIAKLDALEEKLHNPRAEVSYDIFARKGGAMLYSQLSSLLSFVQEGEGPPTKAMAELARELEAELQKYADEFEALRTGELAKLNEAAKKLDGVPVIFAPAGKKP